MTDIGAHIGLLDDPSFNFYDGNYSGNIPKRLSPDLYLPVPHDIHSRIWALIRDGADNARQLDWGAVGVICTRQQLLDFMGSLHEGQLPHIKQVIKEAKKYIRKLDPDTKYVLVAYETGLDYGD